MNWKPSTLSRIARSNQNQTLKFCESLENSEAFLIDCFRKISLVREADTIQSRAKDDTQRETIINTVTKVNCLMIRC